jgi:DNA-binding protein HU-beta
MTKNELLGKVAAAAGVPATEAEAVISAFLAAVTDAAKAGDKVAWPSFGTFQGKTRPAREGRNPATGATIKIPATKILHFGAAAGLKSTLNS